MIGELPRDVEVGGKRYAIRTDFRDILTIISAFNDEELDAKEKLFICLYILFEDFESIPPEDYEAAYTEALRFIDCGDGSKKEGKSPARVMDWEQDERILFPAINSVAGYETRAKDYIHWWTFMGYFMEIREGVFSQVLSLRQKKSKGKPLEKWEREFWQSNKDLCVLRPRLSKEEKEERDRINALLDG